MPRPSTRTRAATEQPQTDGRNSTSRKPRHAHSHPQNQALSNQVESARTLQKLRDDWEDKLTQVSPCATMCGGCCVQSSADEKLRVEQYHRIFFARHEAFTFLQATGTVSNGDHQIAMQSVQRYPAHSIAGRKTFLMNEKRKYSGWCCMMAGVFIFALWLLALGAMILSGPFPLRGTNKIGVQALCCGLVAVVVLVVCLLWPHASFMRKQHQALEAFTDDFYAQLEQDPTQVHDDTSMFMSPMNPMNPVNQMTANAMNYGAAAPTTTPYEAGAGLGMGMGFQPAGTVSGYPASPAAEPEKKFSASSSGSDSFDDSASE